MKDTTFLIFNYSNEIFIENISNKIKLSELENYFNHISNDNKRGLACEIIIGLGELDYWAEQEMINLKRK